jgi:hypothetical protein
MANKTYQIKTKTNQTLIVKASKRTFDYRKLHPFGWLFKSWRAGVSFTHQENDYIDFCTEINSTNVLIEDRQPLR